MAERRPIITLTTDFGESDYFVAAMKASILSINPAVELVDITHLIPPHDIYTAAFTLLCCYKDFPKWTIHLVVVDPGVGSARRPIMVGTDEYYFIGPDNGIFSYVYQRETVNRVVHLNVEHYFRSPVSNTFHGRDIFAPCAAALSKGVEWRMMGEEIQDATRFNLPMPQLVSPKQIRGVVIHVDRFGNVITNITKSELPDELVRAGARVRLGTHDAGGVLTHFAEAKPNTLFAYFGSAGFLELAVRGQSAARTVEAKRGMDVSVTIP
ncbi:MAG TPA: SAM-dependent chlorinase/fluorinase [Blastocatellia bacterium]